MRGRRQVTVDLHFDGTTCRATVDGIEEIVEMRQVDASTLSLVIEGRQYRVDLARRGRDRLVAVGRRGLRLRAGER